MVPNDYEITITHGKFVDICAEEAINLCMSLGKTQDVSYKIAFELIARYYGKICMRLFEEQEEST